MENLSTKIHTILMLVMMKQYIKAEEELTELLNDAYQYEINKKQQLTQINYN